MKGVVCRTINWVHSHIKGEYNVELWQATHSPPELCVQPTTVSECIQIMLLL
jgi:hypothetical protein